MVPRKTDRAKLAGKRLFPRGKLSSKGWVVIPKEIRDEMGLQPGDEVQFALWSPPPGMKQGKDFLSLHVSRIPEDPVAAISGLFERRPGEESWTENLVQERRKEAEREEREIRQSRRKRQAS
jgi:AbrB family looped-hinge helix DNA binding protein